MDVPDRNEGGRPWRVRRRLMFMIVAFSMGCIAYVLSQGQDTRVGETVVSMAFAALISITGTYVFGAVWSDKQ